MVRQFALLVRSYQLMLIRQAAV